MAGTPVNRVFNETRGRDPLFRTNDGSNSPDGFFSDTSTLSARRVSFSMLRHFGTIRVGEPLPTSRDFRLVAILDPYYHANPQDLSLFRRPLPSVNVAFNVHVMWDGRESEGGRDAVRDALINQANDATQGHAQRPTPIDTETRQAIA